MKLASLLLLLFISSMRALSAETDTDNYPTIMNQPELSTFARLGKLAGLDTFFEGTGPFTVFAPSNSAFEKLNKKTIEELEMPKHRDQLIDLINYHVIHGAYRSTMLKTRSYRTINGKDINVKIEGDTIYINDAKVVRKDLIGPNGVSYVIDKVLVP